MTDAAGTLHAVAAADGVERWSADVGEPKRGTAAAVAADEVYVGADAGLHALTADGTKRWEFDAGRATTPTVDTDAVYVGERGHDHRAVVAIARADGTERWRHGTEERGIPDTVQAGSTARRRWFGAGRTSSRPTECTRSDGDPRRTGTGAVYPVEDSPGNGSPARSGW